MPTYDYKCLTCGFIFEKFHSMSANPVLTCPKCNGKVKRMIGNGAGLIFKGTGFYETDYKKKPVSSQAKAANKSNDKNPK